MVTYVYIVKCPECEDEFFDFFDEAKDFAMGCLTNKPIITQTEVNRNDFGECTDHQDLGQVWSWEDLVSDSEVTTAGMAEDLNAFDDFDVGPQSDEFAPVDFDEFAYVDDEEVCAKKPITEATEIPSDDYYVITTTEGTTRFYIKKIDFNLGALPEEPYDWFTTDLSNAQTFASATMAGQYFVERKLADNVFALGPNNRRVRYYDYVKTPYECWLIDTGVMKESCERKPIPEGMTIEQLKEEMEENEDIVECTWCEELFEKSECRKEVDLGWLCGRCEMAIKSRGETLTFREGNYWDFLDEDAQLTEAKYRYSYLNGEASAKEQIIAKLKEDQFFAKYMQGETFSIPLSEPEPGNRFGKQTGTITGFDIVGDAIKVYFERYNRRQEMSLQQITNKFVKKDTLCHRFLTSIETFAQEVNKTFAPTPAERGRATVERRNINVFKTLKDTEGLAEEFQQHITNIHYLIPLAAEYKPEDIPDRYVKKDGTVVDATEEDLMKAADNLNSIRDNFEALDFHNAIDPAKVTDRLLYINNDTNTPADSAYNMGNSWHASAKITFDCSLGGLSKAAQDLIFNAQVNSSRDKLNKELKVIDCYRLANALAKYFDNNPNFYKNKPVVAEDTKEVHDLGNEYDGGYPATADNLTEASLGDILSTANDEYGTSYSERDFLDAEGVEDTAAFADIETQNEITAEAQRNKRIRQAYAINKAKAAKLVDNPFDLDFPEV